MSLTLALSLEKSVVVRGESIRFRMTLTNVGNAPVTLDDEDPHNRAFAIRVAGGWKFEGAGDPTSIHAREGEHVDPPRQSSQKTLGPGEALVLDGDIISWIGDLEPGGYTVTGSYMYSPALRAAAAPVSFQVVDAAPVFSGPARRNLPLAHEPRDTAWLHHAAQGFDLFLLRSSPKSGEVTYSNLPVAHVAGRIEPLPSSYNIAPPPVHHVVWAGGGKLQALPIPKDAPPAQLLSVPLPLEDLELVETPYTDERGILHAVLATSEGTPASVAQIAPAGQPRFVPIEANPPLNPPRAVLWYKDEVLVAAWSSADRASVFAVEVPLGSPPRRAVPKKIFSTEYAIIDLVLAQRAAQAGEGYDRLLVILCHDEVNDIVTRKRIEIGSGRVETDEKFTVPRIGTMRLLQSVLADDLTPRYLFVSSSAGVLFAGPDFSKFAPVVDTARKPVRAEAFPALIVPTIFSKKSGTYVRFIEDGKRFVWVRVD